jgi:hypothetical protein
MRPGGALPSSIIDKGNQVCTCTGDPNVEANWKEAGLFGGGKAE